MSGRPEAGGTGDSGTVVEFTVPPEARFARVARAAAAACGSLSGFSVDELGDLRLLVDELFHTLCAIGIGPVTICLDPVGDRLALDIWAQRRGEDGWQGPELELLRTLLDVVSDDVRFDETRHRLGVRVQLVSTER